MAVVNSLNDQLQLPAQQRVGRDDGAAVEQNLAWNPESLAREQATLSIGEAKGTSLDALAQQMVLGLHVFDDNQLLTADPAGEH